MQQQRIVLKRGTDQVVTLEGLQATKDGIYLNAAMVKGTLFDQRSQPVPGLQDVVMIYVPDSEGSYEWLILSTQSMLSKSVEYSLVITAAQDTLHYRTTRAVSVED